MSLFRSGKKIQWTLLPKPSCNGISKWLLACPKEQSRKKMLCFYSGVYSSVSKTSISCLSPDFREQFRIYYSNWLSTKQYLAMLVEVHWVSPFLSLRDYFCKFLFGDPIYINLLIFFSISWNSEHLISNQQFYFILCYKLYSRTFLKDLRFCGFLFSLVVLFVGPGRWNLGYCSCSGAVSGSVFMVHSQKCFGTVWLRDWTRVHHKRLNSYTISPTPRQRDGFAF